MLTEAILVKVIKEALKAHDRKEYKWLKADGSLELLAQLRAEAAIETRDWLMSRARDEALTSNVEPLKRAQSQMMKNVQANEIAIAEATEFGKDAIGRVY